jgi:hypothetical protein
MHSWSCRLSGLRRLGWGVAVLPVAALMAQAAPLPPAHLPETDPHPAAQAREMTVGLDSVFRLAWEQNASIKLARAKVAEAEAAAAVAAASCVPNVLRSEANRRTTADAKVWQQRAELARTASEVLQEAGSTYSDWLAARRSEVIARGLLAKEGKLLHRARALAKDEPAANMMIENIETSMAGHRQAIHKYRYQASAVAARLVYLLNLSGVALEPADADLEVIELAAADQPVETLVEQVRNTGPGINELIRLEAVIQTGIDESRCLQKACDHTGRVTFCGRLEVAHQKLEQVRLARLDQAGKLEAAVREAHASIHSGRDEIATAIEQVRHARESNRLGNLRMDDMFSATTLGDVLQSIHAEESAYFGHLQAVNSHNKAQVRLYVLLTPPGCK